MSATSLDLSQIKTDVLSAASTFRSLIGLGNVNNTADLDKPISTTTQSALDTKLGGSTGSFGNRLLRSSGTGGGTVQDSVITVDDSGNTSGLGTVGCGAITASGLITANGEISIPSCDYYNPGITLNTNGKIWYNGGIEFGIVSGVTAKLSTTDFRLTQTYGLGWADTGADSSSVVSLNKVSSGVLELNNGTKISSGGAYGQLNVGNITQNSTNSSAAGLSFVNTVSGTTGKIQAGYAGYYNGSLVISSETPNTAAIAIGTEIVCVKGLALTGASQTIKHSSNTHNRIDWSSAGSPGANISALTEMRLSINSTQKVSLTATDLTCSVTISSGFQTLAANPTTADVTTGYCRMVKNSTTGELRLWVNDNGTMKSVLLS